MEVGDVVAILFGHDVPCVLRPHGDRYQFVGDCYVRGIMRGEMVAGENCGGRTKTMFQLV